MTTLFADRLGILVPFVDRLNSQSELEMRYVGFGKGNILTLPPDKVTWCEEEEQFGETVENLLGSVDNLVSTGLTIDPGVAPKGIKIDYKAFEEDSLKNIEADIRESLRGSPYDTVVLEAGAVIFAIFREYTVRQSREKVIPLMTELLFDKYYTVKENSRTLTVEDGRDYTLAIARMRRTSDVYYREGRRRYAVGCRVRKSVVVSSLNNNQGFSKLLNIDNHSLVLNYSGSVPVREASTIYELFLRNDQAHTIVFLPEQKFNLTTLPFAPAGTVRDTKRGFSRSFNVENRGCYLVFDRSNNVI